MISGEQGKWPYKLTNPDYGSLYGTTALFLQQVNCVKKRKARMGWGNSLQN